MLNHNEIYKIEKLIWTTDDFEKMGWLDCHIHGIAFDSENFKILFDIDYIYAWVNPPPDEKYYSFWVAPCTLVFENVYDINFDITSSGKIEILDLTRSHETTPRNAEFIGKKQEWTWILDCNEGEVSFKSVGFTQYTRKEPQHISAQSFSLAERGGIRFDIV